MHFTVLYVLKGKDIREVDLSNIEEDFSKRYCDCCGGQRPLYGSICDSFKIKGNHCNILKASNGIVAPYPVDEIPAKGLYAATAIRDCKYVRANQVSVIATLSRTYDRGMREFSQILDDIRDKKYDGVIVAINCHNHW